MYTRYIDPCKITTIGNSAVGKTSLILCLTDGTCVDDGAKHAPTIGMDMKMKYYGDAAHPHTKLCFWDTAGQEVFASISKGYLRGAHAVLLVYNPHGRASFNVLPEKLMEIQDAGKSSGVLSDIYLVATHSDITTEALVSKKEREAFIATLPEAQYKGFFPVSSRTKDGVEALDKVLEKNAPAAMKKALDSSDESVRRGSFVVGGSSSGASAGTGSNSSGSGCGCR